MEKFPLVSGNLALDLVNTEMISHGKKCDHLLNEADLIDWLSLSQRIPFIDRQFIGKIEKEIFAVLNDLKSYRSFLRKQFEDAADGKDVSVLLTNHAEAIIDKCPLTLRMVANHISPYPVGGCRESLATLISVDVMKLVAGNKLPDMHRCANPDCMLLFLDSTGRRKWCSMKLCGNKMKAARFRKEGR
ncbi:MAG: CGNR zinc finger domain-containing protein [Sporolactobacillus sp.]